MTVKIDASALRPATLVPPPSKSDAQRAVVLAHLTGIPRSQVISNGELAHAPADLRALCAGLDQLLRAAGTEVLIDCGDGGAPFRFLLGQAAVTPRAEARLVGSARLGERPHSALVESLRSALGAHGLEIREGDPWPIRVRGADGSGSPVFQIDARRSSQYASSLLLASAALAKREGRTWAVELEGGTVTSEGYLEMTVAWLTRFGFEVSRVGDRFEIGEGVTPRTIPAVPGDWSSIGYLLLVAWASRGSVARVQHEAAHPDQAIVRVLGDIGLKLVPAEDGVRVEGKPSRGLTASGAESPDLLPTLAALACVLPAPSVLHETGILRHKESDRLQGILDLVKGAGGEATLEGETLTIVPPEQVRSLEISTHGDHRMAMTAATLAVLARVPVEIDRPECVDKSFPGFWDELARAGVSLR